MCLTNTDNTNVKNTVAVFANGQINDYAFIRRALQDCRYIIACDGGMRHNYALGIQPDVIIGDLDSADAEILHYYQSAGVPVIQYPSEKDETDLVLALRHAFEKKPIEIFIFGGMGGRFDHALANAHVLAMAQKNGVPAVMLDEHTRVRVTDAAVTLYRRDGKWLSLLPLSSVASNVLTCGMQYPLKNEDLTVGETRGVSNVIIEDEAAVSVEKGMLLVIQSK